MSIEQTIRQELGLILAMDSAEIQPNKPLIEYGLDSVRAMELVVGVEEIYDLEINDNDVAELQTLADLIQYVESWQPEEIT